MHERCYYLIYSDKISSYVELLEKDGSFSVYQENILYFQQKCTKSKMITQDIQWLILSDRNETLQSKNRDFEVLFVRTIFHGSESISYLGQKIWNILWTLLKGWN